MAKVGFEVEGKYQGMGLLTYFCDVNEYLTDEFLFNKIFEHGVGHVYICDHANELDLELVAAVFYSTGIKVTVELTELRDYAPDGVEIMWNMSRAEYSQSGTLKYLRWEDQVKVEQDLFVLCWKASDAVATIPSDFAGDITV